ncbi:MAG: hypothetical protein ABR509_00115 [Candidatus Limnocylindria bacterium]
MTRAVVALVATLTVFTGCGGAPASSPRASTTASATRTARTTPTERATTSEEPSEPSESSGGAGADLDCPDIVDTAEIEALFEVEATGPSGAEVPPGVGELAPGLNQHVCIWDAPGVGLYADVGGRVGFIFGDFPDASAVRTEFERIQQNAGGESITGVGDAAFYVTDEANYSAVEAIDGGDYVIATAFGIGPVDREPLADLARTVLARN